MVRPSTKTRTYDTVEKQVAEEFFTADRIARRLDPSTEEMQAAFRGAVSISAYAAERGRKSPFPNPEAFICDYLGTHPTDPCSSQETGRLNAQLLRLVQALHRTVEKITVDREVEVDCPLCEEPAITAYVGVTPAYNRKEGGLVPSGCEGLVHLSIRCDCTSFDVEHYGEIERRALNC